MAFRPIRRGQLISPFGVGSMVDFPRDESLMTAGLDAWPYAKQDCPPDSGWKIREERLEVRLGVDHFRLPPASSPRLPGINVPFVRFPRWHYCHHCGGMEHLPIFSATGMRCRGRQYDQQSCDSRNERRRPFLIPVRFVAICDSGHIQDFPFMEWLHTDQPWNMTDHNLRLRAGRSSAGLSGISIECSCNPALKRNLGDIFQFDEVQGGPLSKMNSFCLGQRPWLGEQEGGENTCGNHLRVVQRGASNVYFNHVVSSIYLPLWAENVDGRIVKILEEPRNWEALTQGIVDGKFDTIRVETLSSVYGVDKEELKTHAQRKLDGRPAAGTAEMLGDEEAFRFSEYEAISKGKVGPQTELYVQPEDRSQFQDEVAEYFSSICLVHKLRETRVLAGFTRYLPPDGTDRDPRVQPVKLDSSINWLPAIKVYGEGIFLDLDRAKLEEWSKERLVRQRVDELMTRYNQKRIKRGQVPRPITPAFILIHTFAHVLINQLSFDCGYGSASLRERLYCNLRNESIRMSGLLVYTASGDSEGTMGGLVRQGSPGRLESTIIRAIKHAAWCSSDPVCIESAGQGTDGSNLAACHGCCLLSETSCEEGNRILDRALLVGTPQHPEIGFFRDLLG